MRPGDGSSPHSSVGDTIMRLHEASLTFTSAFWSPPPGGLLDDFSCLICYESLCTFFEPSLSWEIIVPSIMTFFYTVVAGDTVKISPGYLLLLFFVAFIVPSFPTLRKHDLVAELVGLVIYMRVISRLIV